MFFTVLEIQMMDGDTKACIPVVFDSEQAATASFYQICAAAAISTIPYHASFILADNGQIIKSEIFDRRNVEE